MKSLGSLKILVAGDLMLDRYWFGDVSRISPEAPVPVVKIGKIEERLGGAGNVARNVSSIGARCALVSVMGSDDASRKIDHLLKLESINNQIIRDPELTTTIKLRVIGRQQQLVRLDFEAKPDKQILSFARLNFFLTSLINWFNFLSAFLASSRMYFESSFVKSNHWKPDGLT